MLVAEELHLKSVTLVLGGVRSGKSRYAQQLAQDHARVTFVATARRSAVDTEMLARISRHVADRPAHWVTLEEQLNPGAAVRLASAESDCVLLDCLTLFAANLLEEDALSFDVKVAEFCAELVKAVCPVVLVSNEVGSGVVPAYESGRRFRDFVGELNQRVAALADTVVYMVAGLPMVLKSPGAAGGEGQP